MSDLSLLRRACRLQKPHFARVAAFAAVPVVFIRSRMLRRGFFNEKRGFINELRGILHEMRVRAHERRAER